jgi:endoglycosylceramidase
VKCSYLVPLAFFLAFASGCGAPSAPAPADAPRCSIPLPELADWRLDTDGTLLRDSLGRIVTLRGVNAGGRSKLPPYVPFDFAANDLDAALARYLDRAQQLGFSALRVPFSWAAVEPMPGMDDETFLARYDALLQGAWQRRMWTIVDFHQDIYAERLCGDGFPDWTIPEPKPAAEKNCADWFTRYSKNADVRSAFDRLWANSNGTRTALEGLWDRLATRYADEPGVIGFEVINEPHPGTADLKTWSATTLTDFYGTMGERIHLKAPQALVFFDATGTDGIGATTNLGKPAGERLVFAPHWYDPAALFGGTPSPANAHTAMAKWAAKGREWDLPVLLGESGIRRKFEEPGEFVSGLLDAVDENQLHFTYWEYSDAKEEWNEEDLSIVGTDGIEAKAITAVLVRPHPRAVAGDAPVYGFDSVGHVFSLAYDAPVADGVTEIAVSESAYPSGYRVEFANGCVDSSHPGLLLVRADPGVTRVDLKILPR